LLVLHCKCKAGCAQRLIPLANSKEWGIM
jgi:hypothetical protein